MGPARLARLLGRLLCRLSGRLFGRFLVRFLSNHLRKNTIDLNHCKRHLRPDEWPLIGPLIGPPLRLTTLQLTWQGDACYAIPAAGEGSDDHTAPDTGGPSINRRRHHGREAYNKATDVAAEKIAAKFIDENKGKVFILFSYCDNDGRYFCTLEHGDLFHRLPHLKISHH